MGKSTEGGTLKRLLLLAALCMAAVFVFAPAGMAQEDVDAESISALTEDQYDDDVAVVQYDDDVAVVQYDDETATATATASASASALPDTGGVVSPTALSLVAALLLVGGGIMSASIIRRR
jgi:hypothetical protein